MEFLPVLFLHFESAPKCTLWYINKLPIRSLNLCFMLMITNIKAQMGKYLKKKDLSYSKLQGIWALVQNKRCLQK